MTWRPKLGEKVRHTVYGEGDIVAMAPNDMVAVDFVDGIKAVYTTELSPMFKQGDMFKKGDRVVSAEYGECKIVKGPIFGFVNDSFDSEAKYDVVPDGGRLPYRLFESTLTLIPKKLRITREQKYQSACEELIAAGCEVFTHEQTLPRQV